MLVKSLVAGTVLTLLAGGVVYYGTDLDSTISATKTSEAAISDTAEITEDVMAEDKESQTDVAEESMEKAEIAKDDVSKAEMSASQHPHSEKAAMSANKAEESSADIPSLKTKGETLIDPKAASVKADDTAALETGVIKDETEIKMEAVASETETNDNMPPETVKPATANLPDKKPKRKWIDQYLKSDSKASAGEVNKAKALEVETKPSAEKPVQSMEHSMDKASMNEDSMDKKSMDVISDDDMDDSSLNAMVDEEMDKALFSEEKIMEADAKVDHKAVNHKAKEPVGDPKTLHDIVESHNSPKKNENIDVEMMKNEDATISVETKTIDLGGGKVMKIVKTKPDSMSYGSGSHDNEGHETKAHEHEMENKKIHIKVMTENGSDSDVMSEIIEMTDGTKIKIRKKIASAAKDDIHAKHSVGSQNHGMSATAKLIFEQAEKITLPELRDRAYLDLVSYAIDNHDKAAAKMALSKIQQVELRDTARNRIAIAYAKAGKAEKAFAILEDIEVDALRDVMRLQVIEALIVPEDPHPIEMQ